MIVLVDKAKNWVKRVIRVPNLPGDGITWRNIVVCIMCFHGVTKDEGILAWKKWLRPQGNTIKALTKSHIGRKLFRMVEAYINMPLVIIPDCPQ